MAKGSPDLFNCDFYVKTFSNGHVSVYHKRKSCSESPTLQQIQMCHEIFTLEMNWQMLYCQND